LHDLPFLGPKGGAFSLYHDRVFGWPKAIHLAASAEDARPALERFAQLDTGFDQAETQILAITRAPTEANADLAERLKLPFLVLSDPEGALHKAAGFDEGGAPPHTAV
ncbi:MAG: redoxin domain-containing protein, partial [Desulfuromonadales bacterium]|nr:redoxin domain-containing protein [Desulfuromonadales bacterium]